jgi:hypothetical protein
MVQTASSQDALPDAAVILPVAGPWVPTVQYAHTLLMKALRDMQAWQCMLDDGKKLLRDMLDSRLNHKELGTKHDLRYRACAQALLQINTCELWAAALGGSHYDRYEKHKLFFFLSFFKKNAWQRNLGMSRQPMSTAVA